MSTSRLTKLMINVGMDVRKLGEVLALPGLTLIELDYDETTSSMVVHVSEVGERLEDLILR